MTRIVFVDLEIKTNCLLEDSTRDGRRNFEKLAASPDRSH
jgi:hypothetical protein